MGEPWIFPWLQEAVNFLSHIKSILELVQVISMEWKVGFFPTDLVKSVQDCPFDLGLQAWVWKFTTTRASYKSLYVRETLKKDLL